MRKLMALAIVLTLAGATRSWAALGMGDINFDGSLEVSGNSANNETDQGNGNDHRGNTLTRLRLGMNAEVTEGVKGRIELIRAPRLYGTPATNLDGEQTAFNVHNAYLDLNLWDHLFRLGRQYVGNAGDLVWNISPTDDDNLTANSIDGLLIQCRKMSFLNLDFFTGKIQENEATTGGAAAMTDAGDSLAAGDSDINLSSLDAVLPTIIPGGKINIGYLWGVDSSSAVSSNSNTLSTIRVGLNGGVRENMLTYRAEYFLNGGQDSVGATGGGELKYKGSAIDLGLGLNPAETGVGSINIWGNYLMGSGDDNTADGDDESFHDFSVLGYNSSDRLMGEIFGKSNALTGGTPRGQGLDATGAQQNGGLTVVNLGISFKPKMIEKTTLKLDWFSFARTEDTQGAANIGDAFGDEIDLTLAYAQSDNVNIEGGYAMLSPDDALTLENTGSLTGPTEDITKLFARVKVKWGGEAK